MGTNYYVTTNICPCCQRGDKPMHIGKNSSGWAFTFRGYKCQVPTIQSAQDWVNIFTDPTARIKDEYDRVISPADFWNMVRAAKNGRSHHKFCVADEYSETWEDAEGYVFNGREFS